VVKEMSDVEAMEAMLIENMERENLTDYEVGRWFKLLMEKYPDKYPNVIVLAKRFGYKSHAQIVQLLNHYEAVEQLKEVVPANIVTRVTMLPERVVREIRRADAEYWATLVKAYFKSIDEGKPLGVAGVAALVDSFCRRLPEITRPKKEEKPKPSEGEPSAAAVPSKEELEKPSVTAEVEAAKAEVKPKPEEVEAVVEEARRHIIAERETKKKLDIAGHVYLTLINYYPEELVVFLEKYCDLSIMSETQIVKLARGIIGLILEEVTDYGKNMKPLEKALETYKKWR
jgi:hypothetical protein